LFQNEEGYTPGEDATEIYHFKLPSNEPYGMPRWISQTPSVLGSREAEMVNLHYFQDNTVPPLMLTVSGGRLTASSHQEITRILKEGKGASRQNRIVLVEAVGEGDSLDSKATPVTLRVEKLASERPSDALFEGYDKNNRDKVRSAWRLPAIVVGQSADSNYANASVSLSVAETQVFGPERDDIDEVLNNKFLRGNNGLGLTSVKLKGRIPAINSADMTIKTLTALNVMGGVTPRTSQNIANQVLQNEIPEYPAPGEEGYEDWMDKPLAMTLRAGSPTNTHVEQGAKTEEVKEIEGDGMVGFRRPENGSEAEVLE
jgi:capsid portal protein